MLLLYLECLFLGKFFHVTGRLSDPNLLCLVKLIEDNAWSNVYLNDCKQKVENTEMH